MNNEKEKAEPSADGRTKEQLIEFFERTIWLSIPFEVLGKPLTKREREKILGYGPHGV